MQSPILNASQKGLMGGIPNITRVVLYVTLGNE